MSNRKYTEGTIDSSGLVPVLRWLRKRWVPLKDYNSLADHANERERQVDACRRDYRAMEEAARAVVATLPHCREPGCQVLATHTCDTVATLCDAHAELHKVDWPHLWREPPQVAPLRALLALLEGK